MKINSRFLIAGLALVAIFVRFPDIAIPQVWDSSTEYAEDDEYDSSFLGPLPFCVRESTAAAKADSDGQLQPFLCDEDGKLIVTTAGGGGSNTEYTEGAVDASITGIAIMWEDAGDAVENVSISKPLPVDLGANNDVTVTSGAITATLSATDNAVLDTIDAVLDTIKIDTEAIETAVEGTLTVSDGAGAMNVIVDSSATVTVTATNLDIQSGGADLATAAGQLVDGHNVTVDNASIVVTATNLDVQSGGADLATAAAQLADGHNVTVDNASIAVTATNLDVQIGGSDVVVVDLAGNNDVVATAGLLNANSPTTEVAVLSLFDGSGETQIATTNLGASKAITITGSGALTKMCLISSLGTPIAEDGSVLFFDADPSITVDTADLSLANAQIVVAVVSFKGTDYLDNFASAKINCQLIFEPFHSITHVVYHQEGSTTFDDEDMEMHLWYRRDS